MLTAIVEDFAGKLNIDRACCPEKFRGNLHLVATSPCALGKVADFQNSGRLGVGFLRFVFLSVGKKHVEFGWFPRCPLGGLAVGRLAHALPLVFHFSSFRFACKVWIKRTTQLAMPDVL